MKKRVNLKSLLKNKPLKMELMKINLQTINILEFSLALAL